LRLLCKNIDIIYIIQQNIEVLAVILIFLPYNLIDYIVCFISFRSLSRMK